MNKNVGYWDKSYKAGELDYFFSTEELGHYLILLGYIIYVCRARRVLDAGCGAGRLLELLLPYQLDRYVGVDISAEAIERSRLLRDQYSNIELHIADIDSFSPMEDFDVIVFNESIYYSGDPLRTLKRAAEWLTPGGALLLSMCRDIFRGNHEEYWGLTSVLFTTSQATTVSNRLGQTWDVRILNRNKE
jgi:SAM-dependent methyltransferase